MESKEEKLNISELRRCVEKGGTLDTDEIEKLQAQIMAQYQNDFPTPQEEDKIETQEESNEEPEDFPQEETQFEDFSDENDTKEESFSDFEDFSDEQMPDMQNFDSETSLFHQDFSTTNEDDLNEDKISVPEFEQDETQSLNPQEEYNQQQNDELRTSHEEPENSENQESANISDDISQWEELSEDNSVVKKYIAYIARDFVPYLDSLSMDDRMAYINDAIQMKMDYEDNKRQEEKKTKTKIHLILVVLTFLIMTPIALFGVNKAILLTFENYKYSQENFEKLYKQRFEKNSAYMRSVEYNRELERRLKLKK